MARQKGLVRTRTLKQHARDGLIEKIEIVDDGEKTSIHVHYNEKATGQKMRILTAYRSSGPKTFVSIDSAWKLVKSLDLHEALIREENVSNEST